MKSLELAARGRCIKVGENDWLVFSLSSTNKYKVTIKPQSCTCPDFELRQQKCKHIYAVEYTIEREVHSDGSETLTRYPYDLTA